MGRESRKRERRERETITITTSILVSTLPSSFKDTNYCEKTLPTLANVAMIIEHHLSTISTQHDTQEMVTLLNTYGVCRHS